MTEEAVSIRPADPFAPESLRLIEQLWSELGALYPEVNGPPFPPKDIVGDRAVFVLAWSGGQAIGCDAERGQLNVALEIAMYNSKGRERTAHARTRWGPRTFAGSSRL